MANRPSTSSRRRAARGSSSHSAEARKPKQKKEHGYIPRPRNAFIIFRSDFVKAAREAAKADPKLDQTLLSQDAGVAWNSLSMAAKAPFLRRAKEEKAEHAALYPNYRYSPGTMTTPRKARITSSTRSSASYSPPPSSARTSASSQSPPPPVLRLPTPVSESKPKNDLQRFDDSSIYDEPSPFGNVASPTMIDTLGFTHDAEEVPFISNPNPHVYDSSYAHSRPDTYAFGRPPSPSPPLSLNQIDYEPWVQEFSPIAVEPLDMEWAFATEANAPPSWAFEDPAAAAAFVGQMNQMNAAARRGGFGYELECAMQIPSAADIDRHLANLLAQ
ncbi:HMG box domain-containing protein [Mycena chlorophos]|uniref:HMG box domain-containing protein n=1 Tax=Mycena chlorophos TaxID=658473 RepID=A0A8H6WIE1_MYCCL|nr:HMG box domain-containing protein [Mycena chlorophos]